jgi:hypothetical protein
MQITLDETQFGFLKEDHSKLKMSFYYIDNKGNKEFITVRHGDILISVTKKQYQNWIRLNIFCEQTI